MIPLTRVAQQSVGVAGSTQRPSVELTLPPVRIWALPFNSTTCIETVVEVSTYFMSFHTNSRTSIRRRDQKALELYLLTHHGNLKHQNYAENDKLLLNTSGPNCIARLFWSGRPVGLFRDPRKRTLADPSTSSAAAYFHQVQIARTSDLIF